MTKLIVVTATTNPARAQSCFDSWGSNVPRVAIINGTPGLSYMGTVPAFRRGVDEALDAGADLIACLHDDLRIDDPGWAQKVVDHFDRHPACGLAGFGGAIGLGADDIYQTPYNPMQLARIGFRSNLQDAEVHGIRSLLAERVACLDGFSEIGRREFFEGKWREAKALGAGDAPVWPHMEKLGLIHHAYDSYLGVCAARQCWETWYLPIRCHHYGGQTAVGDAGYQQWARTQTQEGDHGFWEEAHKLVYEASRGILPIRL